MIIINKDFETKEIEVRGFREILRNPKHKDYKELRVYIKNGWIPIDTEDNEKEIERDKRRKQRAIDNKKRKPKYDNMEDKIKKLNNKTMLDTFYSKKQIKGNYNNVLKWYNEEMKKIQDKEEKVTSKGKAETKIEETITINDKAETKNK